MGESPVRPTVSYSWTVPVRQWVLSVPHRLRSLLAPRDPASTLCPSRPDPAGFSRLHNRRSPHPTGKDEGFRNPQAGDDDRRSRWQPRPGRPKNPRGPTRHPKRVRSQPDRESWGEAPWRTYEGQATYLSRYTPSRPALEHAELRLDEVEPGFELVINLKTAKGTRPGDSAAASAARRSGNRMSVGIDGASSVALERPGSSHSLAAAAHCRRFGHPATGCAQR
jgi:hypothetical protein